MEEKWNIGQSLGPGKKKEKLWKKGHTAMKSGGASYVEGRDRVQGPAMPYAAALQGQSHFQAEPKKETAENGPTVRTEKMAAPYLMGRDQVREPELPYGAGAQAWGYPKPQAADATPAAPAGPKGEVVVAPYLTGKDQVKEPEIPYGAGAQAGIKSQRPVEEKESGHWLKRKTPPRTSLEVLGELNALEQSYDEMLQEAEGWESQAALQDTPEEMSQWEKKGRDLRKKAAELEPYLDALQKEWEYAMDWEWEEEKKREGYRDPTLRDLTIGSFQQGYDTAQFGKESYRDMLGEEDNRKAEYEEKLAGEEYKFMPEKLWQIGLSGISSEGGELLNKAVDPDTLCIVGTTTLATSAGGVTAPVGLAVGSTAANAWNDIKIETGLTYDELLKNGVSEETARPIAEMVGGAAGLLGAIPVDSLMESLGILQKGGVSQKAVEIILDELKRRGIIVAGETLLDTAQEGLTIAGVQAGTKIDTGEWAYNGKQVTDQLSNTMVNSAIKNGFLEIPGMVKSVVTEAGKSSQGVSDALVSDQMAALMLGDQRTKEFLIRKGHLILTKDMSGSQKIAAVKKAVETVVRKHQN